MTDDQHHDGPAPNDGATDERRRRPIESAVRAYATYLRSVERYQKSVLEHRKARASHEAMRSLLTRLASGRESAAAGRLEIRTTIRTYVHLLRAEDEAPEVVLRKTKGACLAIVLALSRDDSLRNPQALLDDTVRWAIEAYYEAA